MSKNSEFEEVQDLLESFVLRAQEELQYRVSKWRTDFAQNDVHEVLGGLLARQVTLAIQLARCPHIWNGHVAPLLLRAMADVYINLARIIHPGRTI